MKMNVLISFLVIVFSSHLFSMNRTSPLIIDHTCIDISQIPQEWIDKVQSDMKWHYEHTSHGRQLLKGLELLEDADSKWSSAIGVTFLPVEEGAFCVFDGHEGDNYNAPKEYWSSISGMNKTRNVLNHNPTINISQFCWCGEMEDYSEGEVQAYLDSISVLEAEFPNVTFVYMTGNSQKQSSDGYNRHLRNAQIRQFCIDNNKVMFDFADLDAWWFNPSSQEWEQETYEYGGLTIQTEHPQFHGDVYGHTTLESCEQKGRGVWWMAAKLTGWTGQTSSNTPPEAADDSSSVPEDGQTQINILDNDVDADGSIDPASVSIISPPSQGSIPEINASTGAVTYQPKPDFYGTDSFTYTVKDDSNSVSNTATVTIAITAVNDAPGTFNLSQPSNSDTLASLNDPLYFVWNAAKDVDDEALLYSLKIYNANADTLIENISDTTFYFDNLNFWSEGQAYFWTALVNDGQISTAAADTFMFVTPTMEAIGDGLGAVPNANKLYPNYPNPFNPNTVISYQFPVPSYVNLVIYNSLGQKVQTLMNGRQEAGRHSITFDASGLASGVYFYKIQAGSFMKAHKMLLVR